MFSKLFKSLFSRKKKEKKSDLKFSEIEKIINYKFKDKEFIKLALTHRSYLAVSRDNSWNSNERIEFLGDAVVNLVTTEFLYTNYPTKNEGILSRIKSILVSRRVLSDIAKSLNLGQYLLINFGEEKTGGRDRSSNLANLYESIVGAIYLDGGYNAAKDFLKNTLLIRSDEYIKQRRNINYKSILLEYAQGKGLSIPKYNLISERGPDHEKFFEIDVTLDKIDFARGRGKSKKNAEQEAAHKLLKKIAPHMIENIF